MSQLTAVEPKERGFRLAGIRVGLPRRSAAALALILGVTGGALLFSAPAQAHTVAVSPKTTCVEGKWQVEWTFTNDWTTEATLSAVVFKPAADGAKLESTVPAKGSVKVTVSVDSTEKEASLTGKASWADGTKRDVKGSVTFKGTCVSVTPTPTPTAVPTTPAAPVPTPTASRTAPAGPQLPVTGGRSWILAVGGIAVLALGVALVVLVPRRRLRNRRA